ncbi:MAG: ECF transporter S component [Oscillospiraceae bacterium]|nr:ECF transporter S component [Oscillospiraceae bacterium]
MKQVNHASIRRMTALSLLTTIVVVLQLIGGSFHIGPIPFSLVLVPIAVGAVLYGPLAGGFLGTVFGIVVLIGGITGSDQFTFFLWSASPFWTAAVCLVKGALAGVVSGLVYRALQRHVTLGCVLAAVVCPIVNTGIFALAMLTVLREKLAELAGGSDVMVFLFTVLIGVNFLVELGINSVLSAAITRVVKAGRKI